MCMTSHLSTRTVRPQTISGFNFCFNLTRSDLSLWHCEMNLQLQTILVEEEKRILQYSKKPSQISTVVSIALTSNALFASSPHFAYIFQNSIDKVDN